MKYNLEWIKNLHESEERVKYIFFWGHTPRKDGQIGQSCMSQWWESIFEVDDIQYRSAEHWMMTEKARLFGDTEILEKILNAKSPAEAKKLGRLVRDFKPEIWDAQKYEIVKQGSFHKFSQDENLKAYLMNTANRVLVEASPYDTIWGIGLTKDAKQVEDPNTWKGENLLGFALMEVRDAL